MTLLLTVFFSIALFFIGFYLGHKKAMRHICKRMQTLLNERYDINTQLNSKTYKDNAERARLSCRDKDLKDRITDLEKILKR